MHETPCSGRHPQSDSHQWVLGRCPGGSYRCPCINGGACSRWWRVAKPHVQPQFHPYFHGTSTVVYGCMKRLAQGVTRSQIRTNGCLGVAQGVAAAAHASTEALACGGGVLPSRRCNVPFSLAVWYPLAVLHACTKRLAQGVTRRRIRTIRRLDRAQEVAATAHASTEALALDGGVLVCRRCNVPFPCVCASGKSETYL